MNQRISAVRARHDVRRVHRAYITVIPKRIESLPPGYAKRRMVWEKSAIIRHSPIRDR